MKAKVFFKPEGKATAEEIKRNNKNVELITSTNSGLSGIVVDCMAPTIVNNSVYLTQNIGFRMDLVNSIYFSE